MKKNNHKDELLDQVDKNDKVVGTVLKSKAHRSLKIIHREAAMLVFNDEDETLLQQRSLDKENDPGQWKIAAAGHVGAGEKAEDAVRRELFEELGIKVEPKYWDKFFKKRTKKAGNKEARFVYTYYGVLKGHPRIRLNNKEVNDAKWVKVSKLKKFSEENDFDPKGFSFKITKEIYSRL